MPLGQGQSMIACGVAWGNGPPQGAKKLTGVRASSLHPGVYQRWELPDSQFSGVDSEHSGYVKEQESFTYCVLQRPRERVYLNKLENAVLRSSAPTLVVFINC